MLLEKCKMLGKSPGEILHLPVNEDTFLTHAISKRYEKVK